MYTTHCDDFYLNKNSCSSRSHREEKKEKIQSIGTNLIYSSVYSSMHVKELLLIFYSLIDAFLILPDS